MAESNLSRFLLPKCETLKISVLNYTKSLKLLKCNARTFFLFLRQDLTE